MPRKLTQGTAGIGGLGTTSITTNTISTLTPNTSLVLSPGGTGQTVVTSPLRVTNDTQSTDKDTGALITDGGVSVAGAVFVGGNLSVTGGLTNSAVGTSAPAAATFTNIEVTGLSTFNETVDVFATKTLASGTVTHDFLESNSWYHSSIAANFTVNLTNTPTTADRFYTITIYLAQGGTGRLVTGFQIDGAAQTINWAGGVVPTPSASGLDIQTFSLYRSGSTWYVFASYVANGAGYPGSSASNPAPSGFWLATNLKNPLSLTSGYYWIKSPTMPNALQMYVDMTREDGGYDFYPITSGTSTNRVGMNHSGQLLGLDIVYPRSQQHWIAMRRFVTDVLGDTGNAYFQTCYAVYRTTTGSAGSRGGNYTGVIMRDPRFYGTGTSDWRTGDGGRWWLRDTTFGEPNGDYNARAYLGLASGGYSLIGYTGGDIGFNDGTESYFLGSNYLVSTNAKP